MVDGVGGYPSPSPPRDDLRDGRMRSDRMDARRDASPRRFSPATLFVGGLNFVTDEATLRDACEAHGEVDSVKIIYDHDTRRSRGFAFVAFEREADARRAAERMDGRNLDGRRVRCNLADERRRGGDVAGASDRRHLARDSAVTRRDERDRRDARDARDAKPFSSGRENKRRRRSVSPSAPRGPSDDENDASPDADDDDDDDDDEASPSPRVVALESLLAKTRREAVAQRERADAAEAALAKAVGETQSAETETERDEEEGARTTSASRALRAALRLTLRALAELDSAPPKRGVQTRRRSELREAPARRLERA